MSSDDEVVQLHERLRQLLPSARAESCQIVATFIDIRGFSTFSTKGESFDTALYLRSIFSTVLDKYFPDVDFFKPTGDGMLLVHELPPDVPGVKERINSILARCVSLVDDFGQLTSDDIMVNFSVPQQLGAGIARGSVTRLVSGDAVLDYTGRCLNLAARLMDKARPFGVVFADQHASAFMTPEVANVFATDQVCVRGISEQEPIKIHITYGVEINPSDREPIKPSKYTWGTASSLDVEEIRESTDYGFWLPRAPHSYEAVSVLVQIPSFDGQGRQTDTISNISVRGKLEERPGGFVVRIPFKRVIQSIADLPATTKGVLGRVKKTSLKFTPFCGPVDEDPV